MIRHALWSQASLRVAQPQPSERPDGASDPQPRQDRGFREEDFPAAGPSGAGAGAAMPPRWAAAAGGGRGSLGTAEFPELSGACLSAAPLAAHMPRGPVSAVPAALKALMASLLPARRLCSPPGLKLYAALLAVDVRSFQLRSIVLSACMMSTVV